MTDPELLDIFQRLGMALGIGFLLGVERGWRHRDAPEGSRAAGLRTHAVTGLLGGVAGALAPHIGPIGVAAIVLSFAAALIVFKLRESARDNDVSVTGTIAALTVFALGVYCMFGDLRVAAALGVVLVALMAFKEALHDWLEKLTWKELRSALVILAATFIALPLLPDRVIDLWGAVNPRELWLLTILVAGASFAGYVAVRVLGERIGLLVGAASGAMVSSTVVTADLGRRARIGETPPLAAAAGACLAAAISVGRVCFFLLIAAPMLATLVLPAALAGGLVFLAATAVLQRRMHGASSVTSLVRNPLDLSEVGQFAAFLCTIIIVGHLAVDAMGELGLLPFAATAGIVDVDAATLAAVSLVHGGLAARVGAEAVLSALVVNTLSKAGIAFLAGGARYALAYLAAGVAAIAAGAAVWSFAGELIATMLTP